MFSQVCLASLPKFFTFTFQNKTETDIGIQKQLSPNSVKMRMHLHHLLTGLLNIYDFRQTDRHLMS